MEGYKTIFYATLVAAAVFVTANSAPTQSIMNSMAAARLKRSTTEMERNLLQRVYVGLDILQKVSFYEMMKASMNISNDTTINLTYHDSDVQKSRLVKALDITCDLHRASTELIPAINNASTGEQSGLVTVLGKLGDASASDSCSWLQEEVRINTTVPAAFECNSLNDICMMKARNDEYKDALSKITVLDAGVKTGAMNIKNSYITSFTDTTVQQRINDTLRIFGV